MNDRRYAVRQLLKRPGFSLVVVWTLAIGLPVRRATRVDPMEALRHE